MQNFLLKPYLYLFIVLLGIGLKFYRFNDQFFWDDEICTILHTSGISMAEYERNIPVNVPLNKSYYNHLLEINAKDISILDQFIGLAKMPQLTPGHYYYLIIWTRIFGDSIKSFRYFSLAIFLLTLPLLFLFTHKILRSNLMAWIVVSLFSVSPLFQYHTQEARYYILWSFMLIALHYVFLMAVDKEEKKWWIFYIVVGFLAVHTSIITYVMLLAHAVYFLIFFRDRWKALFVCLILIFLSGLPWIIFISINRQDIQHALAWLQGEGWADRGFLQFIKSHFFGIVGLYTESYRVNAHTFLRQVNLWIPGLLVMGGFILLFWKTEKKQKVFLGLITIIGIVFFIILDYVTGNSTSLLARYHLLYYAGFMVIVGLALKFIFDNIPVLYTLVFLFLVGTGIISSKNFSDDPCKYNRDDCYCHLEDAAEYFSGNENILIISDFQFVASNSYTMFMSLLNICENEGEASVSVNYGTDIELFCADTFDLNHGGTTDDPCEGHNFDENTVIYMGNIPSVPGVYLIYGVNSLEKSWEDTIYFHMENEGEDFYFENDEEDIKGAIEIIAIGSEVGSTVDGRLDIRMDNNTYVNGNFSAKICYIE